MTERLIENPLEKSAENPQNKPRLGRLLILSALVGFVVATAASVATTCTDSQIDETLGAIFGQNLQPEAPQSPSIAQLALK